MSCRTERGKTNLGEKSKKKKGQGKIMKGNSKVDDRKYTGMTEKSRIQTH